MRPKDTLKGAFHWNRQPRTPRTKRACIFQNKKPWLFLAPSLAGAALFIPIPFVDVVIRSSYQAVGGRFVGLENFIQAWNSQASCLTVRNTPCFILVRTPPLMTLSLWAVVLITTAFRGGNVYGTTILLLLATPVASAVLLREILFYPQGLLNQLVVIPGFGTRDWLNQDSVFYVLVLTYIWKNIGHDMMLWLAGLNGISLEPYEAARANGVGSRQTFYYVILSCLKGTVFLVTVPPIINSFKVFWEVHLVSGDYPHESTYMTQCLFNNWFVSLDTQKTSATSVMIESSVLTPVIIWIRWRDKK